MMTYPGEKNIMPVEWKSRKRSNMIQIYTLVRKSGRSVFNAVQLSKLSGISIHAATITMKKFVDGKYATRLRRGQITFSSNSFVNATQMIEPSYVTGWTAFLYHEMTDQVSRMTDCATTVNSMSFDDLGFEYHKIQPNLFYGFVEMPFPGGSYFYMATKEKAIIDAAYLRLASASTLRSFKRGHVRASDLRRALERYDGKGKQRIVEVLDL